MEGTQRTDILEALAAIVAERGIARLTLAETLMRANVTRRAFHGCFEDMDEALLAAFDLGVERATERIAPVYVARSRWRDGIRPAVAELLRFLDDEPALGRLCVVHALSGGPALLRRRLEVSNRLWQIVDRGRDERAAGRTEPPEIAAEGVVGAVLAVLQTRLLAQDLGMGEDAGPAIELFGSLMSLIVLPYLGSSAARRELSRPAPLSRTGTGIGAAGSNMGTSALPPVSSSEAYGTRLTYRTGRVLQAIAQYPGASTREVAERAGIVDQGQISKLLTRLERAGAIANLSEASSAGAPNSWQLTAIGQRMIGVIDGSRRMRV